MPGPFPPIFLLGLLLIASTTLHWVSEDGKKTKKINTCIFPSTGGGGVGIFVIVLEFVGVRRRSVMGTSLWFSFPISLMGLAGIAYLIKDWRTLCIVTAAPAIPLLLGYWYVSQRTPDSVMGFFSTATSFFSLLLFF